MDVSTQHILQNIYRAYLPELERQALSIDQRKAVESIVACRRGELGTSYYQCAARHGIQAQHHACRHRSCHRCAQRSRHDWIEAQQRRLLNCPHFHLVFTLPSEYRVLWQYNTAWFAHALFASVQETVLTLMADERFHGVTPGLLLTLHTWGRRLNLHPHIHCLVTGGGLDRRGQWRSTGDYLLPVQVLKRLYRSKLQARLKAATEAGALRLPPDMDQAEFTRLYRTTYSKAWSVRVEEQYRHGKGVVLYLSRYLRGGPLHPGQICRCDSDAITFIYKDHRDGRRKQRTLAPLAFLQGLLRHVPPKGVHTVRHYGLYAAACRDRRNGCRRWLGDLAGLEPACEDQKRSVIRLSCGACGAPMVRRYWTGRCGWKGNSLIERRGSGFVQQVDESGDANVPPIRGPCALSGQRRLFYVSATPFI